MYPFERIVVATDFGPSSERAVDLAVTLAATHGSALILVHAYSVFVPMYPVPLVPAVESMRDAADGAMHRAVIELRRRHSNVEGHVRHGDPRKEILAQAKESEADIIVMGTHGHHGMTRLFLGSVAAKVVRSSTIPVLTVRTPDALDRESIVVDREIAAA